MPSSRVVPQFAVAVVAAASLVSACGSGAAKTEGLAGVVPTPPLKVADVTLPRAIDGALVVMQA